MIQLSVGATILRVHSTGPRRAFGDPSKIQAFGLPKVSFCPSELGNLSKHSAEQTYTRAVPLNSIDI